jgi:hypothetical protein
MRLIKTYLLRLYVDTDASEQICGDLCPLNEHKSYPFKNMNDFAVLLRQFNNKPARTTTPHEWDDSQEKVDY